MIESGRQQVLGLDNNCKCLDWCRLCGTDKAIKEVPHSFHVSTPAAKAQTSVLEVSTKIGKVKHHAFALSKLNFIFCFIFGMVSVLLLFFNFNPHGVDIKSLGLKQ